MDHADSVFEDIIEEAELDAPEHLFGDLPSNPEAKQELFKTTTEVLHQARICQLEKRDASAWYMFVVALVMAWDLSPPDRTIPTYSMTRTEYLSAISSEDGIEIY